ncbi:hypothetical protein GCM10009746_31060 [Microbacterium paludicola]
MASALPDPLSDALAFGLACVAPGAGSRCARAHIGLPSPLRMRAGLRAGFAGYPAGNVRPPK